MANRWFTQFTKSLEKAPVHLFLRATFGASSAVTLDTANSKGVASIVKSGTGDFTITLSDSYVRLFSVLPTWDQSGVGSTTPTAPIVAIKAQSVNTVGGGTIEILTTAAAGGSGTDPDTGGVLLLDIILSNSTAF